MTGLNRRRNYALLAIIALSNGMVPLLIGSTMFVWLKEQGLNLASIGLYSLANLPFACSFIISALLEYSSAKTYFRYKYILLLALLGIALAVYLLPSAIAHPLRLFNLCLLISLCSTVVRVILLALQKILFADRYLLLVINVSTISYKVGIILAGSLALYLSQYYSWTSLYHYFAYCFIVFALIISLFSVSLFDLHDIKAVAQIPLQQRILAPFQNLWQMPQLALILLLMFFYRAPDNLITHYFDLFYLHFGLSKTNVAFGYKLYGMISASLGGIICVKLSQRYSYYFNLTIALSLHLLSYLLIYWFSRLNAPQWSFYLCVTLEEFTRGMTMIIFWSFQTHICKRQHVLIQLAVLTAIDSLSYTLFSSVGGSLIQIYGYSNFILMVLVSFIPAFIILARLRHANSA